MNIFLSGIGGVSMSGLAHIALSNGHKVLGSDLEESESVKRLKKAGAVIYSSHSAENIDETIDLFVYTAAIREDNPEYIKAKKLNIKMQNRAQFLGDIMKGYENSIAIAGTHGKTTTTSMLSTIMMQNDPTILVGGNLGIINGNVRIGNSDNFITEACEYTNSFLNFEPTIGVVLNIEADHLDYFKDLNEIIDSFNKFGKLVKPYGYFIVNGDDKNTKTIGDNINAGVLTFGQNLDNDVVIDIKGYDENGFATFTLNWKEIYVDIETDEIKLSVPGEHNVYNATAAILSAYFSGLDMKDIIAPIKMYTGVGRRFEHKGITKSGAKVVDDYAHHPTEIKATLNAVKNMDFNKVYVTFQPHTFTRTETLLDEFSKSFDDADVVVIPDIYASRELFTDRISSKDLVIEIIKNKKNENQQVVYIPELKDVASFLDEKAGVGDIILTVGAGDIYKVGEMIVK
jgi:UDP-N-acetylmuramate--alanine ligase